MPFSALSKVSLSTLPMRNAIFGDCIVFRQKMSLKSNIYAFSWSLSCTSESREETTNDAKIPVQLPASPTSSPQPP